MNRSLLSLPLLLALLAGLVATGPAPARADGFVVNDNSDGPEAHDWLPGDGLCTTAWGFCTLRAAIEEANAYPGADTITFASRMTIYLDPAVGPLPAVVETLAIDASGVWNKNKDRPGVTVSGRNQSLTGLYLSANFCEVYGLFLINFLDAVQIVSAYNTIGGPLEGQRNVISSNGSYGVSIYGTSAHHNLVWGNWIGLSITGDSKQPNDGGVRIMGGATENTIGGDFLGEGNVISGNIRHGVTILDAGSDGNRLGANFIGPAAVGSSQELGNGGAGVYVSSGSQNSQIGSSGGDLSGNVIAFNGNSGVILWEAHNHWVEANIILFNITDGVTVKESSGNAILSNEIAYNGQRGVFVSGAAATGNPILANSIHHNGYDGIGLHGGGNHDLPAPTITTASASGAAGTGCPGCTIHLFSDSADEGETYQGFANAGAGGQWSYSGPLTGPNVTATNTDAGGNTSEFSKPFAMARLLLPLVGRDHR